MRQASGRMEHTRSLVIHRNAHKALIYPANSLLAQAVWTPARIAWIAVSSFRAAATRTARANLNDAPLLTSEGMHCEGQSPPFSMQIITISYSDRERKRNATL